MNESNRSPNLRFKKPRNNSKQVGMAIFLHVKAYFSSCLQVWLATVHEVLHADWQDD
jgi:hypothetical protein